MSSIAEAFEAGRTYTQRFFKNTGTAWATGWMDASFSSGQPAYDARVGTALTFTPVIASGNDAIYLPNVSADQEIYLTDVTFRGAQSSTAGEESIIIFDLLGYYPLIDGDSVDLQEMDNTQTISRYTTYEGVQMCLVNHVAPQVGTGSVTVNFTDVDDIDRSVTVFVPLVGGIGNVVNSTNTASSLGSPWVPSVAGCRGVKRVNSVLFDVAPGGLYCLYLVKPLLNMSGLTGTTNLLLSKEKQNIIHNAFHTPRIYQGASLGWLHGRTGSSRSTAWFGNMTFIWK